ncbi:Spore protein SP21 [Roseibium album]|nr:Spore protein SP21 [Roseibium album]
MIVKSDHSGLWPSLYEPFRAVGTRIADWLSPATEASGNESAYDISMELPGVSEEDIELTVDNGVITVSGEKRSHDEKKGDTWYFCERQYGAFRRTFRLPEDAQGDRASANMKDGVLHVMVPKTAPPPSTEAKKISISQG